MRPQGIARDRRGERGIAMIIVLLLMAALISVISLTMLSAVTTITSAGDERSSRVAFYAAESGVAAATEYLYANCVPGSFFTKWVSANNISPPSPIGIYGNGVPSGQPGNPFNANLQASYTVTIYNDTSDPGLLAGNDTNGHVVVHSEGHGPDNSRVVVELEIADTSCGAFTSFGGYAQENGGASFNNGVTASATVNNTGVTATQF